MLKLCNNREIYTGSCWHMENDRLKFVFCQDSKKRSIIFLASKLQISIRFFQQRQIRISKYLHFYDEQNLLFAITLMQCLRKVPTNSKVFLYGLLNMREKQILTSVIEIQKENWG